MSSLPPDSAFVRAQVGGDRGLPVDTQLLAMVADALRLWLWMNADPKQRGPRPAPLLAEEPENTSAEIARRLLAQRTREV